MEVFYKLIAPEYEGIIAKRDTEGGSYIHVYDKWIEFDTQEFFGEGLFKDEYEVITEKEASRLIATYNKQIKGLYNRVESIAKEYHKTQVDLGGNPYINHVCSVVDGVELLEEKIIAYLHDTLEDTPMTIGKMRRHRIPEFIIAHVNILTHDKEGNYLEYVRRLRHYPLAKNVKLSDLKNNMDTSRLKKITEEDKERLKKYKKACKILKEN